MNDQIKFSEPSSSMNENRNKATSQTCTTLFMFKPYVKICKIYQKSNPIFAFILGFIVGGCFIHYETFKSDLFVETYTSHSAVHTWESFVANELATKVRIFCMITTMPKNHDIKALVVKSTWARRCNGFMFMSSETNSSIPTVAIVDKEGRDMLWTKTKNAIIYTVKNFINDYDYFLKADDDTYVIVENLRKLLFNHKPTNPFIMGRRFKKYVKQGYMSGGGGYVLSRAAMLNIYQGLFNDEKCKSKEYEFAEDVKLGYCAESVGVSVIPSLDSEGRECFHPFNPGTMLKGKKAFPNWFEDYNYNKIESGFECCSDFATTFHYIAPSEMYSFEYMLYHLHPYGIHRDPLSLINHLKQKKIL